MGGNRHTARTRHHRRSDGLATLVPCRCAGPPWAGAQASEEGMTPPQASEGKGGSSSLQVPLWCPSCSPKDPSMEPLLI